jgi:peptidoglycan/LPS O-acetylase OafA/YrhL
MFSHLADSQPGFYVHPAIMSVNFWLSPLSVLKYTPLRILVAGRASVLLFFVLSGFVLYLSERQESGYASYIIKRATRILPPFLFAVLFASALYIGVDPKPVPSASDWFNIMNWTDTPTPSYLVLNLLMSGIPEFPTLNSPIWSLVHETRISVIFPLLVILLHYRFWWTIAVTIGVSTIALGFPLANPIAYTIELSIGYVCFFVAGAALAIRASEVTKIIRSLSHSYVIVLWLLAFILLIAPMNYNLDSLAPGLGSVLLVSLCISSTTASRLLEGVIWVWLGRISYSLYLLHVPVLLAVIHLGAHQFPPPILCAIAVGVSFALAELCNRLIEQPSIVFGRRIANRLSSSNAAAS